MKAQKAPWKQPGGIAVIIVVVLINLVADWFFFKPTNLALFLLIEAIILGGIFWAVRSYPNS
jgi:hypothetical protein